MAALEGLHAWEERSHTAKELLREMLQSRSEALGLSKKYDIWWVPVHDNLRFVAPSM